jgi:hypothetical protein
MNYVIKMMNGDKIIITEEVFEKIAALPTLSGMVRIKELPGIINLSSASSILSEEKTNALELENTDKTIRKKLSDGTNAIRKRGIWYDEDRPGVTLDTNFYKSLNYKPDPARDDALNLAEHKKMLKEKYRS